MFLSSNFLYPIFQHILLLIMDHLKDYKNLVKLKCTWHSNVEKMDIENCLAVRLGQCEKDIVTSDILDLIEESYCNCVNFVKPEERDGLFLYISCDPRLVIKDIVVCSEAKVLELFGKAGEYLSTHSPNNFEGESSSMYIHTIHMNNSKECSLKFEQLKNTEFAWIYGVLVYVTEAKDYSSASLGPIDMHNVQCLLKPGLLPENAFKLMSSLKQKESKSTSKNILDSILATDDATPILDNTNFRQLIDSILKQYVEGINNKLDSMAVQINTIQNHVVRIEKQFTELSKTLEQTQNLE